jgi:hypothetical protein
MSPLIMASAICILTVLLLPKVFSAMGCGCKT